LYANEKKLAKLCEGDVWSFKNVWQIAADGCILILDLHAPVFRNPPLGLKIGLIGSDILSNHNREFSVYFVVICWPGN